MKRNGVDFFPFPCHNSTAIKLIESKFKLRGFAIIIKLFQKIYAEEGYYLQLSDDVILLLTQEFAVNDNLIPEVIAEAVKRDIFDKTIFEKYNVLTSLDIQKTYLTITRKRTKKIVFKKEYILPLTYKYLISAEKIKKSAENLNKGKESKVNESKVNESILDVECDGFNNNSPSLIKFFKEKTGKIIDCKNIPKYIDINLLCTKINNSQFLKNANNFSLQKCILYYDKIIKGFYDDDKKQHFSNERNYTQEELNAAFTNLDEIDF